MSALLTMSHKHQWHFNGSTGDAAGNRYRVYQCQICQQRVQIPAELGVARMSTPRILTPWFPPSAKPVHVGVYEVRTPNHPTIRTYAHWNGKNWGYFAGSVERAAKADQQYISNCGAAQNKTWRGLTEKAA